MNRPLVILLILIICIAQVARGNDRIDSLKNVLANTESSTTKVKALTALSNALWKKGEYQDAMQYAKECLKLTEELNNSPDEATAKASKKAQANILNIIGVIHYVQSDYPKALEYYGRSAEIGKELDNKKALANTYNNMGLIYEQQSNYPQALNYYFRSFKMEELLIEPGQPANEGVALSYNNIGNIYYYQSNFTPALNHYFKSLEIFEELGYKPGMALIYNNIGIIYERQLDSAYLKQGLTPADRYSLALDYYFKSLKLFEELGNKQSMAGSYTNIGTLFTTIYSQIEDEGGNPDTSPTGLRRPKPLATARRQAVGSHTILQKLGKWAAKPPAFLDSALRYHQKAIYIEKELSDEYTMTHTLSGIAKIYFKKGEAASVTGNRAASVAAYNHAVEYYQEAALLADSISVIEQAGNAHKGLSDTYEKINDYQLALYHHQQYSTFRDSTFNEEKSVDLGKLEANYEFETAETERARALKEKSQKEKVKMQRRDNLQYSGILIFLVLVFVGLFFIGRFSIPIRLAEGMIFFAFLLFFEFTLVLLDPYIEQYSSGAPAVKLTVNAVLAGLIFPLHSFFEGKLKWRISG